MTSRDRTRQKIVTTVIKDLEDGLDAIRIVDDLQVEYDLTYDEAASLVLVVQHRLREETSRAATRDIFWGTIATAIGVGITASTYVGSEPGGAFLVLWGPVVYGVWRLVHGFWRKTRTAVTGTASFVWAASGIAFVGGVVGFVVASSSNIEF